MVCITSAVPSLRMQPCSWKKLFNFLLGPTKKQRIKLKLEYMLGGEETQAGRTGEIDCVVPMVCH